ncbi:MAG: hypothetical protein K2N03_01735 [Muribaculaceae bacterium]|nr:hypothetical protein [Muribaculaceae bacterium]
MTDKYKESLGFVVRFYRKNAFRPNAGFIVREIPFWRRHIVAASIVGITLIAIAAVTTYVILEKSNTVEHEIEVPAIEQDLNSNNAEDIQVQPEVKLIEFENASLPEIVNSIEKTYNVKVKNVPEVNTRLTLSYEGTAEDLIETINEMLGIDLSLER